MSFNKKYGNDPTMLNYVKNNITQQSPQPSPGLSQYAIFEQTVKQIISPINTAINWNTVIYNNISGLVLSGKQIQNTSNDTLILLVTFNAAWGDNPTATDCWINKQLTTDNPDSPSDLIKFVTGEVYNTYASPIVGTGITTTSIVQLESGSSINTCIYTDVNTKTIIDRHPRINIVRIA
jgi:hypothetical protein